MVSWADWKNGSPLYKTPPTTSMVKPATDITTPQHPTTARKFLVPVSATGKLSRLDQVYHKKIHATKHYHQASLVVHTHFCKVYKVIYDVRNRRLNVLSENMVFTLVSFWVASYDWKRNMKKGNTIPRLSKTNGCYYECEIGKWEEWRHEDGVGLVGTVYISRASFFSSSSSIQGFIEAHHSFSQCTSRLSIPSERKFRSEDEEYTVCYIGPTQQAQAKPQNQTHQGIRDRTRIPFFFALILNSRNSKVVFWRDFHEQKKFYGCVDTKRYPGYSKDDALNWTGDFSKNLNFTLLAIWHQILMIHNK